MEWRVYHIYYTNIDRLLHDCVAPFLRTLDGSVDLYFWERHFAGGPNLRLHFYGRSCDLDAIGSNFVATADNYLMLFPSDPISTYSSDDARQMLEMEGEAYEADDLSYKVNAICQRPYQRLKSRFVGGEGLQLLHEFLRDSNRLSETILAHPEAKLDYVLRFYFLNALFPHGDLAQGAVSFKSHWSGFAASFPTRPVIENIRRHFEQQKDEIIVAMLEVQEAFNRRDFSADPIVHEWLILLERFGQKADRILRTGIQISSTMNPEEVRVRREFLKQNALEPNEFMRVLLEDERFVAAFGHEHALAWQRVLTNLLYMIIPALGLTILDKMALCYFTHRAVEEHFQLDLTDVLRHTISTVLRS